jgi:hypothetical protein
MIKKPDVIINTLGNINESIFSPIVTYSIMNKETDSIMGKKLEKRCYLDSDKNIPIVCHDRPRLFGEAADLRLQEQINEGNILADFNIYQNPENTNDYYLKTSIENRVCELSNNFIYCNLENPTNRSYFNFTQTGADTFKMSNTKNNDFCKLNKKGQIECVPDSKKSDASNFSIKQIIL